MSSREVAWVCVGVALVGACQGAAASDLFDTNAVIDGDASTRSDGDTPSTSSSSSGSPDAASSSSSSSGAPDAAPDAPAVDLDPSSVFCSAIVGYCPGANPVCCAGRPGSGALGPYQCKAACLATETTIECDDNDDCAGGEVCCVTNNANGTPQSIACKAAAACPAGESQTTVCDPGKAETCGNYNPGTTCKPFGNLDTGFICIP